MSSDYKYLRYILRYFKGYWFKILTAFAINVSVIGLGLIPVEAARRLIDEAIPAKDIDMVLAIAWVIIFAEIVVMIFSYLQDILRVKLNLDISRSMEVDFLHSLFKLPSSQYSRFDTGQIMERLLDDTGEIVDSTFSLVLQPIINISAIAITLWYMIYVSPKLTLVSLFFVPILILVTIPANRILRKKYSAVKINLAGIYDAVQEKVFGMKEIITHNKINYETRSFNERLKEYYSIFYDYTKFSSKIQSVISILSTVAPYLIIIYATYEIIHGRLEIGTLVAFSMLISRLFDPLKELVGKELELQTLAVSTKRVFSLVRDVHALPDGEKELDSSKIKGVIEFNDVSFSYGNKHVFKNLNLRLEPGKMTLITGANGIGKSTLSDLVLRTLDPKDGKIILDGKDIKDFQIHSLRHNIGFVSQKPFLFSNTILYNILYGHSKMEASMDEVSNAAKTANVHHMIESLPKGYHTHIADTSSIISQGQAHRITIARAILRAPKILLLDDPTLGLDPESIEHLLSVLKSMKLSRTLIIISNDIHIARKADRIILLGRKHEFTEIEAIGNHKQLLKKSSLYATLVGARLHKEIYKKNNQ